jgi:predicted TIM-barrel fold metal-dependent hydrolase
MTPTPPQHPARPVATGWDCHVHVFEAGAPVRPGHYTPVAQALPTIEAEAAAQGIGHLVIVQPSVYGTDHQVLLRALRAGGGRHRGVAVVEPGVSEAELDALQAAGVCGVRFNLVSPAGHAGDPEADLVALAPRLRARGWHVQWYLPAVRLAGLVALQRRTGLLFVLDHLAGLRPDSGPEAWAAAQALADGGAWLKLSGWYRLGAAAPYGALRPTIERAVAVFGAHTVWGSDWPHTAFSAAEMPPYAAMLEPAHRALGDLRCGQLLHEQARLLYQGPAGGHG